MTVPTQIEKAERFAALHAREGAFIIPNPWDAGSARLVTSLGQFEALATTSGGCAYTLGKADGQLTRDEVLANARQIVAASHLPVSGDLENGYGHEPEQVAETIRLAADAGLVGGSIEDATGSPERPRYSIGQAVERIHAAVEAARALPFKFMLVARCENYLNGFADLDETITRLQAYESAGADVLFAPGVARAEEIRSLCGALSKPVNVIGGLAMPGEDPLSVAELAALGVRRISLGSALCRTALSASIQALNQVTQTGRFGLMQDVMSYSAVQKLMSSS